MRNRLAVHKNPCGLYRAYKKINGKEYQYYFNRFSDAQEKQLEMDQLAELNPKKVFSECGRLLGFRFAIRPSRGKEINGPHIECVAQMKIDGRRICGTKRYKGQFEPVWAWMLDKWKTHRELTREDMAHFMADIKEAKFMYVSDIGRLKEHLKLKGK